MRVAYVEMKHKFSNSLIHPEENQSYPIFIGATGVGNGSLLPQQDEMRNHQIIMTAADV
jgi:hypothetical protein